MRNRTRIVVLATALAAIPVFGDDKPSDKPSSPPKAAELKNKYVDVGRAEGKVARIDVKSSELVLYANRTNRGFGTQELTLADGCKVWTTAPPQRIDENGNSKKWTKDELRKMESKAPLTKGLYPGEIQELRGGQQVIVFLSKLKDAVKKPASAKDKSQPEKEFLYVTQIIIKSEDSSPPTKPKKP